MTNTDDQDDGEGGQELRELATPDQTTVARAADRLLIFDVTERKRALADLLRHLADTWPQHPDPLREHALAFAQALHAHFDRPVPATVPRCTWCGARADGRTPVIKGPGTAICGNCIDLVTEIARESREQQKADNSAPAAPGGEDTGSQPAHGEESR